MLSKTICLCAALIGSRLMFERPSSEARAGGIPSASSRHAVDYRCYTRALSFNDYFATVGGYTYTSPIPLQVYIDIKNSYVSGLPVFATPGLYPAVPPSFGDYHPYAPVTVLPRPLTVVPVVVP